LVGGCLDLGDEIVAMSWSPGGQYLAVGTLDGAGGHPRSWLVTADGGLAGEVLTAVPGMEIYSVVVGPDGRRVWLSDARDTPAQSLVEDQLLGRRVTPLPGPMTTIGWTQLGYAVVERRELGDAVLLIDPNDPAHPSEVHGGGVIDRLWISPDATVMVFTRRAEDGEVMFEVVDPKGGHDLEPAGADASSASMLGGLLVYHAGGGDMAAVAVNDPAAPFTISGRRTRSGMISDRGILAEAGWDGPGLLCFEDARPKFH
jgi:hypothetical protein